MSGAVEPQRDNRARLLEAAESMFARQGYAATSVREILRAAGVTGPTLYHYFGSKRDLLLTLLRERFDEFFGRVDLELTAMAGPDDVLTTYAVLVLEGLRGESTTTQLVFSILYGPRAGLPQAEIRSLKARSGRWLAERIQRSVEGIPPEKVVFVTMLFNGMLTTTAMYHNSGLIRRADREVASAIAVRALAMLRDDLPVPALDVADAIDPMAVKRTE